MKIFNFTQDKVSDFLIECFSITEIKIKLKKEFFMSIKVSGIIKSCGRGRYELRDKVRSFRRSGKEVLVPVNLIKKYRLGEGVLIEGFAERKKDSLQVKWVETAGGLKPDEFKNRKSFKDLVALDPVERFNLSASGEKSMRMIDLLAPIGKGTRGLIVSPPKAGKTMLLEKIANSIIDQDSSVRVIVLLINERPEEVTYFKRSVKAEVYSSTSDNSTADHIELCELMLSHVQVELECGRDIVVLVDSLTRMGREFNQKQRPGAGRARTMSGGLSAGALEIPRRFFGLARNIEDGGSVTIVATALIDTGSRMDQLIFEEFKGTGNSEIVLDRSLAQARIFPAIDIAASGTRKEERLYSEEENRKIATLRRVLSTMDSREAIQSFDKFFELYPTNEEFLRNFQLK